MRQKIFGLWCIMILVLSLNAEINLVSSSLKGISLEYKLKDYSTSELEIKGEKYNRILADGIASLPPGAPDLPSEAVWIAIPRGTNAVLRILPEDHKTIEISQLNPVPKPAAEMKDAPEPEFIADKNIYENNNLYPGHLAKMEIISNYRSQICGLMRVYPFQYNPVTGELQIYNNLQIEVEFEGIAERLEENLVNTCMLDHIESFCLNGPTIVEPERVLLRDSINERSTGCDMLIICPEQFVEAAEVLADWKRQKGISTEVVSTDEIGTSAYSIRNWIVDYSTESEQAPQYLLLFGDAEYIPPWYMHQDLYEGQMLGTDVYYADLEVEFDYLSDFSLGRIPVDTIEDAERIVNNIINYEQNPPDQASFYTTAAIAGAFQDGSYGVEPDGYADRRFAKTSEDVRNYLDEHGYNTERYYAEYNGYDNQPIFPTCWSASYYIFENDTAGAELEWEIQKPQYMWDATGFDISGAVNSGCFLLSHRDHGGRIGWGEPAYYSNDVDLLTNGDLLPVVWSINCLTGYFDNETDEVIAGTAEDDECFTEHWLRNPSGGAIGVVSSTRVSFSGNNDRFVWGMMDAVFPDFLEWCGAEYPSHEAIYRMGEVVDYGKIYLSEHYFLSDYLMNSFEELEWFGDPTLEIWIAEPAELTVEHEDTFEYGSTFEVSTGAEGIMCTLWNGEKVVASGVTDNVGLAVLEPGDFEYTPTLILTASTEQHLPYRTNISVTPPIGGRLELRSVYLNDSEGNNDHQADYGELVSLGLLVRNIGSEEVNGFDLDLDFESEYLSATSSNFIYEGSIGVEDSLLIEDMFSLTVSDHCPDEEVIELIFDSEVFSSRTDIILHAPLLRSGYFTISDTLGNNNGAADPGETVTMHLPIINDGSSEASDVMVFLLSYDTDLVITPQQINTNIPGEGTVELEFNGEISDTAEPGMPYQMQIFVVCGEYDFDMLMEGYYGYIVENFETGNFSLYDWEMRGEYGWEIDTTGYSGNYSAKTEGMGANCQAELYMEGFLPEDSEISFYRRLYAETNIPGNWGGVLHFLIDEDELGSWGGSQPWEEEQFDVTAGPHSFRWIYVKDLDPSLGRDAAWIDNIIIPDLFPLPPPQLAVQPEELNISIPEGEVQNINLQITNLGAGEADYFLYFADNVRWQEDSQVILSNYHYFDGQTCGLILQLENNNSGSEGIIDLDLTFPDEICVNILTGLAGGSGGIMLSNGAVGNGANINWHGESGGLGVLLPGETAQGGINFTCDAEMPMSVMLEATITGDQGSIVQQEILMANEISEWLSFSENHGSVVYGEYGDLEITVSAESLHNGNYYQQLVLRDLAGNEIYIPVNLEVIDVHENENDLIRQTGISNIYPNPFNPEVTILFNLKQQQQTRISIYNIRGQRVTTLIDNELSAGEHELIWQADNYSSGIYFINLVSEDCNETDKIILIK